jgi:hypothetical protein
MWQHVCGCVDVTNVSYLLACVCFACMCVCVHGMVCVWMLCSVCDCFMCMYVCVCVCMQACVCFLLYVYVLYVYMNVCGVGCLGTSRGLSKASSQNSPENSYHFHHELTHSHSQAHNQPKHRTRTGEEQQSLPVIDAVSDQSSNSADEQHEKPLKYNDLSEGVCGARLYLTLVEIAVHWIVVQRLFECGSVCVWCVCVCVCVCCLVGVARGVREKKKKA